MMVVIEFVLVRDVVLIGLDSLIVEWVVVLVFKGALVFDIAVDSRHGIREKISATAIWVLQISTTAINLDNLIDTIKQ